MCVALCCKVTIAPIAFVLQLIRYAIFVSAAKILSPQSDVNKIIWMGRSHKILSFAFFLCKAKVLSAGGQSRVCRPTYARL